MSSERDYIAARGRREWFAAEEKQQRATEDRAEWAKYASQLRLEQQNCAPADRIEPLSFEEWRRHIPEEFKDSPAALRGAVASMRTSLNRLAQVAVNRIKDTELSNEELEALGFDTGDRVASAEALTVPIVAAAFEQFEKSEPRFVSKLHLERIGDFLERNHLFPSVKHIRLTFNHLWDLHLLSVPEPEPELERPEGLNQYGVRLEIEPDPALEAQKRREEYGTKIVATGPDGSRYTQHALDRLPANEFLIVSRFNEGRLC